MSERDSKNTAWRKLRSNYTAMAGLIIIAIASFIAIFAYMLAPDHSPNANRMILEIGGRKPGSTQLFLKIPRQREINNQTFLDRIVMGKEDQVQYVPIKSFTEAGDS